jgi:hypothetical protein
MEKTNIFVATDDNPVLAFRALPPSRHEIAPCHQRPVKTV